MCMCYLRLLEKQIEKISRNLQYHQDSINKDFSSYHWLCTDEDCLSGASTHPHSSLVQRMESAPSRKEQELEETV